MLCHEPRFVPITVFCVAEPSYYVYINIKCVGLQCYYVGKYLSYEVPICVRSYHYTTKDYEFSILKVHKRFIGKFTENEWYQFVLELGDANYDDTDKILNKYNNKLTDDDIHFIKVDILPNRIYIHPDIPLCYDNADVTVQDHTELIERLNILIDKAHTYNKKVEEEESVSYGD